MDGCIRLNKALLSPILFFFFQPRFCFAERVSSFMSSQSSSSKKPKSFLSITPQVLLLFVLNKFFDSRI